MLLAWRSVFLILPDQACSVSCAVSVVLDLSSSLYSTRFTLTGNVVASVVETFKQIVLAFRSFDCCAQNYKTI